MPRYTREDNYDNLHGTYTDLSAALSDVEYILENYADIFGELDPEWLKDIRRLSTKVMRAAAELERELHDAYGDEE